MEENFKENNLINDIENYWTNRTDEYNKVNISELNGYKKRLWLNTIKINSPIATDKIKVLDIGTGPGFFAILSSSLGYDVTSIDYTESMLKKAKINADTYLNNHKIKFIKMDAQNLDFKDETFDLIVSRNLTWNLENPSKAYSEWFRVLKKGGRLIILMQIGTFIYLMRKKEKLMKMID